MGMSTAKYMQFILCQVVTPSPSVQAYYGAATFIVVRHTRRLVNMEMQPLAESHLC